MANHDPINSLLDILEKDASQFTKVLDRIIKMGVKIFNSTEELQEELVGFDDIYQTYITDIDFNYWLKVTNGKIEYKKGVNPDAPFKMNYTKDMIVKILKREISGTDAFMRGEINVEGSLTQGLRYIKLFRTFFKYVQKRNNVNS
ncbi:MAG: SCP2 sterol-binding domain-containing protein [Candidatus Odinarchaeota archaeon]